MVRHDVVDLGLVETLLDHDVYGRRFRCLLLFQSKVLIGARKKSVILTACAVQWALALYIVLRTVVYTMVLHEAALVMRSELDQVRSRTLQIVCLRS